MVELKRHKNITIDCDICSKTNTIRLICYEANVKKNGFYRCKSCKPQCQKEYWESDEKKKQHSLNIKSSQEYYDSIKKRDTSGSNNGMFGKTHSNESKEKMSESRTGKFMESATAWKGKSTLTKVVKRAIIKRFNWDKKVIERDSGNCIHCGETEFLCAHHIEPVVIILQRILKEKIFESNKEKIEWCINHPDIADHNLNNGQTLCYICHRKAHKNWGSKINP